MSILLYLRVFVGRNLHMMSILARIWHHLIFAYDVAFGVSVIFSYLSNTYIFALQSLKELKVQHTMSHIDKKKQTPGTVEIQSHLQPLFLGFSLFPLNFCSYKIDKLSKLVDYPTLTGNWPNQVIFLLFNIFWYNSDLVKHQ